MDSNPQVENPETTPTKARPIDDYLILVNKETLASIASKIQSVLVNVIIIIETN